MIDCPGHRDLLLGTVVAAGMVGAEVVVHGRDSSAGIGIAYSKMTSLHK